MKTYLIGSAGSKESLEKIINNYLFSTNWIIKDNLDLYNTKLEKISSCYRIIQKKNRWRFERIEDEN